MNEELKVGMEVEARLLPDGATAFLRDPDGYQWPTRTIKGGVGLNEDGGAMFFEDDNVVIVSLPDKDPMTFDGTPVDVTVSSMVDMSMTANADPGEQIITHKSGVKSSYCPEFSMIPLAAMESLAKRYELGAKKYGRNSWRKGIPEIDYVVARLDHVIRHARLLQMKLQGEIPFDTDDDAGGILWGGAFATEAVRHHFPEIFAEFE